MDVFHISLPITDIFALPKPLLKDIILLRWRTTQHEFLHKLVHQKSTTTVHTLICLQIVICLLNTQKTVS